MKTFERSITIDAPIEKVFHFHDDSQNLLRITPPDTKVELLSATPAGKGQRVVLQTVQFGFFKSKWEVEITEYEPPVKIVDVQRKGPFGKWIQTRHFKKISETQTEMTDHVEYELPAEHLTNFFAGRFVQHEIEKMFRHRQSKTKELLEAAQTASSPTPAVATPAV
jgi:ligand-binding SRPBCC domain-containing protein